MELQQRFARIARRLEDAGVLGQISDSCMFILSKRHELLTASLALVLGDAVFRSYWDAAREECEAEYPSLSYDQQQSWCFWRLLDQMGFRFTLEQVQGQGANVDRIRFFEELADFIERFQRGTDAAGQRDHAQLVSKVCEQMPMLTDSSLQLFDPEFAQLVLERQPAHAVSDTYIHSIEATAQQMQESIRNLRQQVQPVPIDQWHSVFGELQQATQEYIGAARELDQTYHTELCAWSEATAQPTDDLGMGRAAADIVAQHSKLRRAQHELSRIRDSYRAIAASAPPLQDLDQGWLKGLAREALAKVAELRSEVALLAATTGGRCGAGSTKPAAGAAARAGPSSWPGSSSQ